MNDSRDIKLNNLKALLMFLIVFTGAIFSYNFKNSLLVTNIIKIIYAFHMPLFCIISGYYSRNRYSDKQQIRLFGLFMIMNFIFFMYEYIVTGFITSSIIKYTSWYVIDLIIWRLLNKHIRNKGLAFIINIILITILSIFPNSLNILNIDNLLYYFAYFMLGNYFNILVDSKDRKMAIIKTSISLLIIIVLILLLKFDYSFFNTLYNSNPFLLIVRIILFGCNYALCSGLYVLMPNKEIKLITNIGKCSLSIYFFQAFLTMIFSDLLHNNKFIIILGFIYAIIICLLLGNSYVNKILKNIMNIFDNWHAWIGLIIVIIIAVTSYIIINGKTEVKMNDIKYNIVSKDNINDIDNKSITIGTIGNILLFEEQIKDSYNSDKNEYDFSYIFDYTKDYYDTTDYLIGTFDGISDDNQNYTLDRKRIEKTKVNVPSILFKNLKDNKFDLINISNQRILDYGKDSLFNMINNLEKEKIDYTGAYKEKNDKNPKIVTIEGISIGILSYTYAPVDIDETDLFNDYEDIASYLCDEDSVRFGKVKDNIKNDFKYLKDKGTDVIIVMPHSSYYGKHEITQKQEVWNEIFVNYGADIIIGSYSNSTQRIEYRDDTLIINSNGSFIKNKYSEDSDLSAMTKIYIDKERKDINCISIIPVYSYKVNNKGYKALPIYKAFKDEEIYNNLSQVDIDRMTEGIKIITKSMLGEEIDVLESEYYYFVDGYKRQEVKGLEITKSEEKSEAYNYLSNSKKTCYVGDDYTVGSKNGGFGWFEPLVSTFNNDYVKISNTGYTVEDAVNNYYDLMHNSNCDLFVINIGSNDIKKNYTNVDDYINNMDKLLKDINKKIILVSPFEPLEIEYDNINDYYTHIELYDVYSKRLKKYCDETKCLFIDPNPYIKNTINKEYISIYYNKNYFPNSNKGLELYSRSILN